MFIMRHGKCYQDYPNNPSLTQEGIEQVNGIANSVHNKYLLKTIICSSKKRAIQTANIFIGDRKEIELIIIDTIREISNNISIAETNRVRDAYETIFLPNLKKNDCLIISHMNFLNTLFKQYFDCKDNLFNQYGNIVEVNTYTRKIKI